MQSVTSTCLSDACIVYIGKYKLYVNKEPKKTYIKIPIFDFLSCPGSSVPTLVAQSLPLDTKSDF